MAADTIAGYIQGLLNGVEFRHSSYTLDRSSRSNALAHFLAQARGVDENSIVGLPRT
jgi:hypothetical protein